MTNTVGRGLAGPEPATAGRRVPRHCRLIPVPSRRRQCSRTGRLALFLSLLVLVCCPAAIPQQETFPSALAKARSLVRAGDVAKITQAFETAAQIANTNDERARAWFELATFLEAKGRLGTVVEVHEKLVAIEPPTSWHAPALDRLARLYQRSGKLDKALAAYERLATLPGLSPGIARQTLWGQVRTHQQIGNLDKAAAVARQLLDKYPDSAYASRATDVLVEAHLEKAEFVAARKLAEAEAKRENGDANMLLRAASRMLQAGAFDEALQTAELFVSLRPDDTSPYQMIYNIHHHRGTLAAYETQLVTASKDPERKVRALRRLADLYTREQKPKQALDALDRLTRLLPENPEIHESAGRAAMQAGHAEQATTFYERALKLSPDSSRLLAELGAIYAETGEKDKAIALWKRAARYDPSDPDSARMLGQFLHHHGFYHDAVSVYLEARAASEESATVALELGQAYESLLFIDKAVTEYILGMRGSPGMAGHAQRRLQRLALDEVARPDVIAALEDCRKAGDVPEGALVTLGFAHLKAGELGRARDAFDAIANPIRRGQALARTAADLARSGDRSDAVAMYEAALGTALSPELNAQVALRLAALHAEDDNWRRARDLLADVDTDHLSGRLLDAVRLALADILVLRAGNFARAAELYAAVTAESAEPESRRHAAWGLADCAFVAAQYSQATAAYRDLIRPQRRPAGPPVPPFGGAQGAPIMEFPYLDTLAPPRPMGPAYGAYQLAEITFRSGKFKQARQQFERLAAEHPNSAYANDALDRALMIAADFTGESPAEAKYIEALRLMDRGETDRASRILKMIFSLGPDEPLADDAAMFYANGLSRFGDRAEAAAEYEKMAEGFQDSPLAPEALLKAGRLRSRQPGDRDSALKLFRAVLAKFPDSPEAAQAELGIDDLLRK